MAQSTKKRSPSSSASKKKPASGAKKKTKSKDSVPAKIPRRREIGALVCLFLGLFALLGCFNIEAVFISFFCNLVKGLIGWGLYSVPVSLFICAFILGFHKGRPVRARVSCALLCCVNIGALAHLIFCKIDYSLALSSVKTLWADGVGLKSGGAVSGYLCELFSSLFSGVGAGIVFFCLLIFLLFVVFNRTLSGTVESFKNRERLEYEPVEEQPASQLKHQPDMAKRRPVIDIPIDEPEVPSGIPDPKNDPGLKRSFFNKKSRVKTPDELYKELQNKNADDELSQVLKTGPGPDVKQDAETGDTEAVPVSDGKSVEDVPLDIPFMESVKNSDGESAVSGIANNANGASSKVFVTEPVESKAGLSGVVPVAGAVHTAEKASAGNMRDNGAGKEEYRFPPTELLAQGGKSKVNDNIEETRINSERLETAFKSFGINVHIAAFTRGPTVTRYEAELEAGVKLNKLTSLADDIALSLGTTGVRIAAMPNKISTVGIEVPNKTVSKVFLREIIDSPEFKKSQSRLTFAIGKNIAGEAVCGNVAKLPHMLVAGTTGSGKSVCLNSLILSILYKAKPDEVKFIMIDPKMVEFRVYNGIPHLLVPVVTDVKKAAGALQWAVVEMMKRYRLFSETTARDLKAYNKIIRETGEGEILPQIIVVIDELADLMLTAAKEVEESICRVAQMGRAAGVHLIIATQSPRADVITGLMKANIPSRISLKVSSALESRIILDAGGNADKLVGNGDMLYAPIGCSKPIRIQGTWVSDEEREEVVAFIKDQSETQYSDEVIDQIEKAAFDKSSDAKQDEAQTQDDDCDELLPQAVDVILESGQASVSMLQRRLKLGYSRAARIVDQMEERGIVGPFEGSKPRQLLITKQQWQEMQYVNGTAPIDAMPDIEPDDFKNLDDSDED